MQLIKPRRFGDDRGWFEETFSERHYAELGLTDRFRQDNHVLTRHPYVLRGLHFQRPPHAQAKLVSCVRGRIWDVAVDLRRGSPTYGQYSSAELSAENGLKAYIPVGFAHGYLTLEAVCEVFYKVSDFYVPECEGGLIWDDRDLAIDWPLAGRMPILSPKDLVLETLAGFESPFTDAGAKPEPVVAI
jgi:dTDP-4-dehydrorhamnose 3,5-epimerase